MDGPFYVPAVPLEGLPEEGPSPGKRGQSKNRKGQIHQSLAAYSFKTPRLLFFFSHPNQDAGAYSGTLAQVVAEVGLVAVESKGVIRRHTSWPALPSSRRRAVYRGRARSLESSL